MPRHECRCRNCDPSYFPSGPREGEHHFAVRFGSPDAKLYVLLDGVLLKRCTEAFAGREGLVVVANDSGFGGLHGCRNCTSRIFGGACETILRGAVTVTTEKPEGAPL